MSLTLETICNFFMPELTLKLHICFPIAPQLTHFPAQITDIMKNTILSLNISKDFYIILLINFKQNSTFKQYTLKEVG